VEKAIKSVALPGVDPIMVDAVIMLAAVLPDRSQFALLGWALTVEEDPNKRAKSIVI
jgi:hypothetical protein